MSSQEAVQVPQATRREWWFESPSMWWLSIPAVGVPVVWWAMGVSFVLGTWAAGEPRGWPGAVEFFKAMWGLAQGQRIDEAWLRAGDDITAIATAWWLVVFAVAAVAVVVAAAVVVVEWRAAGWPMPSMPVLLAAKKPDPARPLRDFVVRKWPVPPPYGHKCPGPGVLLGRRRRKHLVACDGLPVLVIGPTGSGKTRHVLGPNTACYPGPVIATSVKPDLAEMTLAQRQVKGRVYGFEPTGRLHPWMVERGITPVSWDPVKLMALDPTRETADLVSQFLAGQSSASGQGSQGVWPNLVQAALSDMLLIASEIRAPLSEVMKWMTKLSVFTDMAKNEALRGRLSDGALEALEQLAGDAEKDPRLAGSIEVTAHELTRCLKWTSQAPDGVEMVPVDVAVNGRSDTLFLIADHSSQTTHEALFGAVLRHLFHVAETTALDPDRVHRRPLFALDEFANLAKLPDMPKVISTIRSRAQVIIGIQTPAQLAASWGSDNAITIMDNCATKLVLPGSSDSDALRKLVTLTDEDDDAAMATAAAWRMIEDGYAMAVTGNRKEFKLQLADPDKWLEAPKAGSANTGGPPPEDHDGPPEARQPPADAPDGEFEDLAGSEGLGAEPAHSGGLDGDGAGARTRGGSPFEQMVPPYEVLYEQSELFDSGHGGITAAEREEARNRILEKLVAEVPYAGRSAGGAEPVFGDAAVEWAEDSRGALEEPVAGGGSRWVPPAVLDAGDALGISMDGIEARGADPGEELLLFTDGDGHFGLHPSGCVVDLSGTEGCDEHDLVGI